jgi:hypothetical protein
MMLHWEATPAGVQGAFRELSQALSGSDFYLAGGTALALQFGHRVSVDLDLFSPTLSDADALGARLGAALGDFVLTSAAPRTVEGTVAGVPVSLFGYAFPMVAPLVVTTHPLLPLAGIDDVAAMKLAAIASRGSRKDFVDLWLILSQGRSVEQCLESAARKFGARDMGHIIRSLSYFEDADAEPPLRMLVDVSWDDVKAGITRAASGLFPR